MKYRAEIDGLRALAVVPVILFHAGFDLFSGGFVGVDVFFVISGYLITTILISDIEKNKFSLINFYERRARRILPVLFFVMLACLPFAWFLMVPSQMEDFSQSLIAVSLFASNFLFWSESDYFAPAAEEKPLLHTWSLAVEEQYYFLFPIFLLLTWRYGRNRVFWLIAFLSLASLALSEWSWRNSPTANFYLAPTRAWELLAGSMSAFIVQKVGINKNNTLSFIGLFAILLTIFFYDKNTPFPSLYALPTVVGVVLIILFADEHTAVAKLLSTRVIVGIGLISYSAYLWHQPLFAFARIHAQESPSPTYMLILSAVSMGLAVLSWKFIETPFRDRALVSKKMVLYIAPVFLFFPLSLGLVGHAKNGFEGSLLTANQRNLLDTAINSPKRDDCHASKRDYFGYDDACEYFEGELKVAVFGDSHTVELAYALAKELAPTQQRLKHLSFSNCIPSYGILIDGYEDCSSWTNDAIGRLIDEDSIETVVVSYRINEALFGGHEATFPTLPSNRSKREIEKIWQAYMDVLNALDENGKNVILVMQAPELKEPIERLIKRDQVSNGDLSGISKEWWLNRNQYVRSRISEIPKSIAIVDPTRLFCDETQCYAAKNGVAYYFDDDHMSIAGATVVAKRVVEKMGD